MLVAWDPVTQKERWRTPGGGGIGGGTVTTAGNLVIQVINDGHLVAYSADKGEKLLDVNTGLRGGMGPPITFMLDGKQYVALAGGTGSFGGFGGGGGAGGGAGAGRGAGPGPGPGPGAGAGAGAGAPPAPAGRGGTNDSPDVANAQAAQRGAAPPAFPPAATPKLMVFMLDGKAPIPGQ
jgi:quinohemoprotein ethanol dehydrogenase